jgi:HSP20 family molecular chaperone IbpA
MLKEKKSFFERLAGSVMVDEDDDIDKIDIDRDDEREEREVSTRNTESKSSSFNDEPEEGELSVDVYQTPNEMIIEAMVAGVKPEDLHLSITRDMVTIKGKRDGNTQVIEDNYFYRELY